MVLTTTAGNNKYGFCYDIRTYSTNHLERKLPVDDPPRRFSVIYTVDVEIQTKDDKLVRYRITRVYRE